jgi:hypothetical protein
MKEEKNEKEKHGKVKRRIKTGQPKKNAVNKRKKTGLDWKKKQGN